MTFLVSPTEPQELREAGSVSSIAETYGADILIPAHGYFIGVQRKKFPDDYISSLHDGRLGDSLIKLTKCEVRVLVCEGSPTWNVNGGLEGWTHGAAFSYQQLQGLTMSALSELGVATVWTKNVRDTIKFLNAIEKWGQKEKHTSLFSRPGMAKVDGKRHYSKKDHAVHILQSFEAIGPDMAGRIFDEFGRVPFQLTEEDEARLVSIKGVGPKRVQYIKDALK